MIYADGMDFASLKDMSSLPGDASAVADVTRGVRSIAVHCNGQHLAVGDREGNLRHATVDYNVLPVDDYFCVCVCRIYDLQFMDKIYEEVAHDSEILHLAYSNDIDGMAEED